MRRGRHEREQLRVPEAATVAPGSRLVPVVQVLEGVERGADGLWWLWRWDRAGDVALYEAEPAAPTAKEAVVASRGAAAAVIFNGFAHINS